MARASHPLLRSVGLAIRSLRRARGMSQEALAGRAHIDRSYMSSVERGLRNVSVLNLARIAAALEVPVWDLLRPRDVRPAVVARSLDLDRVAAAGRLAAVPGAAPERPHGAGDWQPRYLSLG